VDRRFQSQAGQLRSYPYREPGRKAHFFKALIEFAKEFGLQAVPVLKEFLSDPDWEVRCAALRALAVTETAEARSILQDFVKDGVPIEEAAQAALALGGMEEPGVSAFLIGRFSGIANPDLRRAVLDSLAGRPYGETGSFFQGFLADPRPSPEEKGEVIAALGFHQTAPLESLMPWVTNRSEEIRTGAYEALSARPDGSYGQMLLGRAAEETEPALRQKAYEAAGAQRDTLPSQMATVARREVDPAARLRAERAWGMTVGRTENVEDRRRFNAEAVPRLVSEALTNPDPGEQRAALQALAMARTPESAAALRKISQESKSPRLSRLAAAMAEKITQK